MKAFKGIGIVVLMTLAALGVSQLLPGTRISGTTPDDPVLVKPSSIPPAAETGGTDRGKVRPVKPGFNGDGLPPKVPDDDGLPPGPGDEKVTSTTGTSGVDVPEVPEGPGPTDTGTEGTGAIGDTPKTGTGTTTGTTGTGTTGTGTTTNTANNRNNTTVNKPNNEKEEMLEFDFKNTDLQIVVRSFATQINKNFILPKTLAGNVTIITGKPIPKSRAFQVLETILNSQGFAMFEDEFFIRIEKLGTPDGKGNPTDKILYIKGEDGTIHEIEKRDNMITAIIVLQYISAQEITPVLTAVKSQTSTLITFQRINALFFLGTQRELGYLTEIIARLDQPGTSTSRITILQLKYSNAGDVAQILNQVAAAMSFDPTAGIAPPTPGRGTTRGATGSSLTIIADKRTNSIIIIASEKETEAILDLVAVLDAPSKIGVTPIHTFQCNNQKATELADLLERFVNRRIETQEKAQPGGVPPLPTVATQEEIFFIADEVTNTLIVQAPPQEWPFYQDLLRKLDQPQRQVLIEVWIVEVSSTDDKTLGVEISPSDQPANERTGALENEISAATLTSASSLGGIFGGTTTSGDTTTSTGISVGTGATIGIRALTGTEISIDGRKVRIPNFDVFLRAVKDDSNVKILATPKLVTLNNEEATVKIADEISIETSEVTNIESTGGVSTKTYSRQEIGIILVLEPQINADDFVIMDLNLEVSNVVGDLSTNPTIARRTTENKVRCENQQTIVISGLRRNNLTKSRTGVPGLMDIPLLGRLFSSKTTNNINTNLLIFITPHIVTETSDMVAMTEFLQNQRLKNEEERFQITGDPKKSAKKKEPGVVWNR